MRSRRLRLEFLFAYCVSCLLTSMYSSAQALGPNEWTWWEGANNTRQAAIYGTLGTPSADNTPGSRYTAARWTDGSGNVWLFGGGLGAQDNREIPPTVLGDLWKLDPATHYWTWVSGSATPGAAGVYGTLTKPGSGNTPGARTAATSWSDSSGNLWLFGGYGVDSTGTSGMLNDLWKYTPATNQWTWMGGGSTLGANCFTYDGNLKNCAQPGVYGTLGTPDPANIPRGRNQAAAWSDSQGNFWLFGGWGFDITYQVEYYFNDVWKFNPSTNEWTWMGGSSDGTGSYCFLNLNLYYQSCGEAGVYGTLGVSSAGSLPGSRRGANSWSDESGNLWLFGGEAFTGAGEMGTLNDVWEFNPTSNIWTWMGGANLATLPYGGVAPPVWGALGLPGSGNIPSGRSNAVTWLDNAGSFWLYGGQVTGYEDTSGVGALNDLWKFEPSSNQWSWMGGGGSNPSAVYGAQGIPAPANIPGTRWGAAGWTDAKDNLWLFGGEGVFDDLGDLWEYRQAIAPLPAASTPSFSVVPGTYAQAQTVAIGDATPGATIYYTVDGSKPTTGSAVYGGPLEITSSLTLQAIAMAFDYGLSAVAAGTYNISGPGTGASITNLASSVNPSTFGEAVTLTAAVTTTSGGTPTGTVTFNDGSTLLGTATLTGGSASLTVSSLPQGTDSIVAVYSGDSSFAPSTSKGLSQTVTAAAAGRGDWTWMSGSATTNQQGVYGVPGKSAAGNVPGNREFSTSWTDMSGHFWLFGGEAVGPTQNYQELNDLWEFDPSSDLWTWEGGSSGLANLCEPAFNDSEFCGQPGVYGSEGASAPGAVPGGRASATQWTDTKGHFWIFGGYGLDAQGKVGSLNDLWQFDPVAQTWEWMAGNDVLGYGGNYNGQAGIYGALGSPSAGNSPGGRDETASWADPHGNLWLFGGYGYDINGTQGQLGDLWKFNTATNQWSWQGGSSTSATATNFTSVYGQLGVPAPGNMPGNRSSASTWTDSGGNLWLFGGSGIDAVGNGGELNDVWEFNPSTSEWAWMGGSNLIGTSGAVPVYGTLGTPAAGNTPGGRSASLSWTDNAGRFWLFGGYTIDANGNYIFFNDLWSFNPGTEQWTWISGSNIASCANKALSYCGQPAVYGTMGVPNAQNVPGSRDGATGWADQGGNLWLFGGQLNNLNVNPSLYLSDLWKYQPSVASSTAAAATPTFSPAPGTYSSAQSVTISDASPGSAIYYTTDGKTTPTAASSLYTGAITVSATETIEAIAEAPGYSTSAVATGAYVIDLPQAATPAFSIPAGIYTSTQNVAIMDSTTGSAIYYTVDGTTPTTSSSLYSTPIAVSSSETIEAIAVANGYSTSAVASSVYTISLPPPDFSLAISPGTLTIAQGQSGAATISVSPASGFSSAVSFACSGLASGEGCTFAPATVTPSGSVVSTTLTVNTPANTADLPGHFRPTLAGSMLAFTFSLLVWRKKRGWERVALLAVGLTAVSLLNGCGGGTSNPVTQPTTSTITVTATSGSLQHSTTLTLTVN